MTISDSSGNLLFARASGNTFYADTEFGTICPGCQNVAFVRTADIPLSNQNKPISNPLDVHYDNTPESTDTTDSTTK